MNTIKSIPLTGYKFNQGPLECKSIDATYRYGESIKFL